MNDWQKTFAAKELELCRRLAKYKCDLSHLS